MSDIWYGITLMKATFMGMDVWIVTEYRKTNRFEVQSDVVGWFPDLETAQEHVVTKEENRGN